MDGMMVKVGADINDFSRKMSQVGNDIKGVTDKAGSIQRSLGSMGGKLTRGITKPALAVGGALGGITLGTGLKRLTDIDTAKAKLGALGHSAEEIEKIMDNALAAVDGTSFGLGEAAEVAASAVAAGVKPGKDLEKYLTVAADTAAVAGTNFNEMGNIFNKVKSSNRAYNDSLQQIEHRGLPIYQMIADEAGVTAEKVREMASEGKISSELFQKAIEGSLGGAAKYMGDHSIVAAFKNIMSDISRVGAAFLSGDDLDGGIFELIKDNLKDIRKNIQDLIPIAQEYGKKARKTIIEIVDKIKELKAMYDELSPSTQTAFKTAIIYGGLALIALGPVLSLVSNIIGAVKLIGGAFRIAAIGIGFLTSPIGLVVLAIGAIAGAVYLIYKNWDGIKKFFSGLWSGIKEGALKFWGSLPSSWEDVVESLKTAWSGIKGFFNELWVGIKEAFSGGWEPIAKLWEGFAEKFEEPWKSVVGFFDGVWVEIKDIFDTIFDPIIEAWNHVTGPLLEEVGLFIDNFKFAFENLKHIVRSIWEFIGEIFEMGMELIQPIVDVGMSAISWIFENVFGTIVIYLEEIWKVISELFVTAFDIISEIVSGAFDVVLTIFKTTFGLIENVVRGSLSIIGGILDLLVGGFVIIFSTAWDAIGGVVSTAFDIMFTVIDTAAYVIQETLGQALNVIKSLFTGDFDKIRETVSDAMNEIGEIIDHVTDVIAEIFSKSLNATKDLFSTVFGGIWEYIKHIFTSILNVADRTVNMMYELFDTVFGGIIDVVVGIWNTISDVFTVGGEGIVKAIETSILGAIKVFEDMKDKFFEGGKNILKSIGKGIAKGMSFVTDPMSDLSEKIRDFLPFSPAKEGALKDIMNLQIAQSIGKSIDKGRDSAMSAMKRLTNDIYDNTPEDIDLSYTSPKGVSGNMSSAVSGAVDISATSGNTLLGEIRDELKNQKQMIIEMDGKTLGKAVTPLVNNENAVDAMLNKFRK